MQRRNFLKTSAGLLAVLTSPGCFSVQQRQSKPVQFKFREYRKGATFGKVQIVTPDDGYYIHTFFDVCPFSPTQKYLAVNKLPYQDRHIQYGDTLEICVIDLENETIESVYSTKGWGFQLGANLNWGKTDRFLYANDVIDNQAVCVRIDLKTKEVKAFSGPMYHINPHETDVISFPLDLINGYQDGIATQLGYGVPMFKETKEIKGAPADQGLWQTDLASNQKKLLLSLKKARDTIGDPFYEKANCYFFHSKYNPQGTRIFQVFRGIFPSLRQYHPALLTLNPDGSQIRNPITREQWGYGGHHPNWHPDGKRIVMNLTPKWLGDDTLRFCIFRDTGEDFRILTEKHVGSGHPSVNQDLSYLISDCYVGEYKKFGLTESPIRLINLNTEEEVHICTVFTDIRVGNDDTFRVDPHPVWSRDFKRVCFNGAPEEKRQVLIADLTDVI